MDVPIGAKVYCADGACGYVTHAILNPDSREVTHMVIQEEDPQYRKIVAPISLIVESTPKKLRIRCKLEELSGMQDFEETHFATIEVPGYFGGALTMLPDDTIEPLEVPIVKELVPPGEVALRKGAAVRASDGHIGQVDELLVSPVDNKITHLVLRKGHLWGKREVTIPVREIDRIEEDTVYLKLDKQAIEHLPSSPA